MPTIRTVGIISKPNSAAAANIVPALIEWLRGRDTAVRIDGRLLSTPACRASRGRKFPKAATWSSCLAVGGNGQPCSPPRAGHIGRSETPALPRERWQLGFLTAISIESCTLSWSAPSAAEHRIASAAAGHRSGARWPGCGRLRSAQRRQCFTKASLGPHDRYRRARGRAVRCRPTKPMASSFRRPPALDGVFALRRRPPSFFPSVPAICITPICPHMLTNPSGAGARNQRDPRHFALARREACSLTIDGQVGNPIRGRRHLVCRSSDYTLRLVRRRT